MTIRPAAVAGSFYPADAETLRAQITGLLDSAADTVSVSAQRLKALIVPHAGYVYSGPVAATAYRCLAPVREQIRNIVLLGPSHHVYLRTIAAPEADQFATPLGKISVDQERLQQLIHQYPIIQTDPVAHSREHCLEVQLPFLQQTLDSFRILPLLVGDIDPATMVPILGEFIDDPQSLIIVSSDLSHYLGYSAAQQLDLRTTQTIIDLRSTDIKPQQACGATAIQGLLQLAERQQLQAEILDLRNSGDTAGPRDRVVGYGAVAFTAPEQELTGKDRSALSEIAKQSIQHGLLHHQSLPITDSILSPALSKPGASFITLFYHQQLHGCIGSLSACRPLAEDVAENAFAAAFRDPRFLPLRTVEADDIEIHLSVLGNPVDLVFRDEAELLQLLEPGIDGLILLEGSLRSTFLPSVWEQLPKKPDFLRQLKRKAGLAADYWSATIRFQRYRTQSWH